MIDILTSFGMFTCSVTVWPTGVAWGKISDIRYIEYYYIDIIDVMNDELKVYLNYYEFNNCFEDLWKLR